MKDNDHSLSLHDLLKSKTSNLHNEIESLNKINTINPSIEDYINYIIIMFKITSPLEEMFLKFDEFNRFFPKTKIQNKSILLTLDLKNLDVDFNKINYSRYVPKINSFEQALGCFYVIEGSSLGSQFLYNKLTSIHGRSLKDKMNFLNGLGKDTFKNWNIFIKSLEIYNYYYPENNDEIIESAINTFNCFKSEFKIVNT